MNKLRLNGHKFWLNTSCFSRHAHTSNYQILSGIQPTGNIHLGNYFGAIKQWVDFQDKSELLLSNLKLKADADQTSKPNILPPLLQIVDLHSLTTSQDPIKLRKNILEIIAVLLGCGIDPSKCIVFKQSSIPYHGHLCWILSTIATVPQLNRFAQYKEKSAAYKEAPLGLFLYPILQTADILLYKGTHVPIGDDQVAHINLAKHLAAKFNNTFKTKLFPIPNEIISNNAGRIKSLRAPQKKMSKSEPDTKSRIELTDSSDDVIRKIRKSVTDMNSQITYDPENRPGVSNLVQIYSIISELSVEDVCLQFEHKDTLQFKMELGERLAHYLSPIRTRILELSNEPQYLESVLMDGAKRALQIAEKTVLEVQQVIGSDVANLIAEHKEMEIDSSNYVNIISNR